MQNSQPESRTHPRCSVRLPVRLAAIEPDRDPTTGVLRFAEVHCSSLNLSRGGALVAAPEGLEPGRRVLVQVEIGPDQKVEALGRVAWRKTRIQRAAPSGSETANDDAAGLGIEFLGGRPDQLGRLERFLARRAGERR